jgi:thiamine pyrophosphokinase
MSGKCIVIGAGDLTVGEFAVGEEDLVIAVDGGLAYCEVLGVEPDLILGDFDSVSDTQAEAVAYLEEQIPERIIRLPREKEDTDMSAALKEGLNRGYTRFHIYAGCGGRFDHTLANIQCLLYLKNRGAVGYLIDGSGMMLIIRDESVQFQKGLEGTMSLFSLVEESKGVTIEGMKYTLQDATVRNDYPVGISNEFIGETATISVKDGSLVCMISYAE